MTERKPARERTERERAGTDLERVRYYGVVLVARTRDGGWALYRRRSGLLRLLLRQVAYHPVGDAVREVRLDGAGASVELANPSERLAASRTGVRLVPFAEADHRHHPAAPHYCRCRCDRFIDPTCPEHGYQLRAVR